MPCLLVREIRKVLGKVEQFRLGRDRQREDEVKLAMLKMEI